MLANDQRDRVLNEVAVMAKSNNLRFQSDETSALFDTFDSSDRSELHELLSLLTHDDAAPCGKGWEGTKPPGCKRSGGSSKTAKKVPARSEPLPTKSKPVAAESAKKEKVAIVKTEEPPPPPKKRPNTGKHSDIQPPKNPTLATTFYEVVNSKGFEITKDKKGKETNRREVPKDEFASIIKSEFNGKYQVAKAIGKSVKDPKIVAANDNNQINAISNLAGISKEQATRSRTAIRDFSGEEYGDIRNYQRGILKDTDSNDFTPKRLKELDAKVADINKFIENAPTFEGEVYRGMRFSNADERKKFLSSIADGYESEAVSSFSSSKKIAAEFASDDNPGVIFKVQNKSGVSVRGLSDVPEEDEVLTPKGARYRIKGTPKKSGKNIHVELEEY